MILHRLVANDPDSAGQVLLQLRLHDAEIFGVDGKGGRFGAMEATVKEHDAKIDELIGFRGRVILLGTVVTTAGGILAGLGFKALEWLMR